MVLSTAFLATGLLAAVAEAKTLWSSSPAKYSNVIREAYPLGNGRLGAMSFGAAGAEKVNLNLDSLWSGGPFELADYTGGNPTSDKSKYLPGIVDWIFENGKGNVTALYGTTTGYGTYQVLGNLSVAIDGVTTATAYKRTLDLSTGVHYTTFAANSQQFNTSLFCSYPDNVCVYSVSSNATLPKLSLILENQLVNSTLANSTCGTSGFNIGGYTKVGTPLGLRFYAAAQLIGSGSNASCSTTQPGVLVVPASSLKTVSLAVAMGSNYDQKNGNAAANYSFRGVDPDKAVDATVKSAVSRGYNSLLSRHIQDYTKYANTFSLELPDAAGSADKETATAISSYSVSSEGDPFVESLLFDFSRHLFISSCRDNSLPPNLNGRWTHQTKTAWGGDYHPNINVQMNHWVADQTGLGGLQEALWRMIIDTWMPRGADTAKLLYGAPGFVLHNEINIFGHTAMKNNAQWALYPVSAAWMMQHAWDNFDYSRDQAWLKSEGYAMIKAVAQFWLSQLYNDAYTKDGTLVVNPCNSAEQGPTTFGCVHYQQLIYQVFEAVLSSSTIVAETDKAFLQNITNTLKTLDKGFHISSWGGVKEWKLPEDMALDQPNNTHRHLSHIVGWFPGYSISSFQSGYTNKTIQDAVTTALWDRGNGTGSDANSGWEKVWRSACWARLNNTERAYFELRYAIDTNFAGNGFSMYSALSTPFQIDANFGLGGAVLSMLVVDLPPAFGDSRAKTVVLGPAIPARWGNGKVKGLRLRGGGSVDFAWDSEGLVTSATLTGSQIPLTLVNKNGAVLASKRRP